MFFAFDFLNDAHIVSMPYGTNHSFLLLNKICMNKKNVLHSLSLIYGSINTNLNFHPDLHPDTTPQKSVIVVYSVQANQKCSLHLKLVSVSEISTVCLSQNVPTVLLVVFYLKVQYVRNGDCQIHTPQKQRARQHSNS